MSSIELWITLASQICLYLLTIFPQINMLMISIKAGLIFKNNYSTENQVLIFFHDFAVIRNNRVTYHLSTDIIH